MYVKPKKYLGQHFLSDLSVAKRIVAALSGDIKNTLEIGPGMGVLTQFLLERQDIDLSVVEIDDESVVYLREHFPELTPHLFSADFLKFDLQKFFGGDNFSIIGNFPYNISSQIFFKILEHKDFVPEIVCMVQKEVAERIASKEGNKSYGILSVLLQCWYDIEYLFTVPPGAFIPPPKVQSAVIRLTRNTRTSLPCSEKTFKEVIKGSFNQRRKTLRNSLKSFCEQKNKQIPDIFQQLRPEQLSVEQFIELATTLE